MEPVNPHHPESVAWGIWEFRKAIMAARTAAGDVVERCGVAPNLQSLAKFHRIADLRLMELLLMTEFEGA